MTRLILTADSSSAGGLKGAGRADIVIPLEPRLVWGPLPSAAELEAMLAPRTTQKPGLHWLDHAPPPMIKKLGGNNLGLIELCQRCETVELWIETEPNAQLVLIWLLDHLHAHADAVTNLVLRHVDATLGNATLKQLAKWNFLGVPITKDHLAIASLAWQAYRAPTPEGCFDLLSGNLSALPLLRPALLELLAELPSGVTGLGATEMRLLEMLAGGFETTNALFHLRTLRGTRIFDQFEIGYLLDGLAHGPRPAVAGLDDELRTLARENLRDRQTAYLRSRLSLTAFGKAIVAHEEDFSRHNPIDRWWGGTRLTNDSLWRCDMTLVKP